LVPDSRSAVLLAIAVLAGAVFLAAGCGSDDGTTTSESESASAKQTVNSAVSSCEQSAEQIGGAIGSTTKAACQAVGKIADQDLSMAGDDASKAISDAAASCKTQADKLPSGQAKDTVSQLCDSISAAG
jgi:hypothetical protein